MSAAEAPKSEQIQANVAAALSRLRGELGASSSPVAGTVQAALPKTLPEPVEPSLGPTSFGMPSGAPAAPEPLPAGPMRVREIGSGLRPFEPTLGAALEGTAANAPGAAALGADATVADTPPPKPDLFALRRSEPHLSAEHAAAAETGEQPDLLSGMEVPPAPPPPLTAFASEDEAAGRGRRMRNRLLAMLLVLVVAGGGAWAYLVKHRSPEGPVPVITAETTPEKVKPADEGGMQVPNQNVQILDNMNSQATADAQATVLPAPEQPVAPPVPAASTDANATPQPPAVSDAASTAPATSDAAPTVAAPSVAAPTVAAPSVPAPAVPSAATPEPAPAPSPAVAAPAAPSVTPPAPALVLNPPAATANASAQTQQAAPEPAPAAPAVQTAAAPTAPASTAGLPAGSIRIQLAALKSEAAAKAQWAKLQKAYPELLGALSLNVEKVDKGATTYYRVQAGPLADKAAAKQLCLKLVAQKQDCIVAR